jgi:adenylate cyclase class IV
MRSRGSLCARSPNCQVSHVKNLEAKFRLSKHAEAEARASAIGYTVHGILHQRDTFFRVANGKLKLREENGGAVLIFYHRGDSRRCARPDCDS